MFSESDLPDPPQPSEPALEPVAPRRGPVAREAILKVVEPAVAAHKCELVELEWRREPIGWVMRLYIEHLGHDPRLKIGGVGIDECARISRDVSMALDVAEIIDHHYNLEVSSPGLERPLTKPEHYRRFVGLRAKVRLNEAMDSRKVFRGEIAAATDASVKLLDEEIGEVTIPYDRIQRAALVYEPAPKAKPGKSKAKSKGAGKGKGQVTSRDSRDGSEQER
jgi:ribosome maturation factor RimP